MVIPEKTSVIVFDTETRLITDAHQAPDLVCMSFAFFDDGGTLLEKGLVTSFESEELFSRFLAHPSIKVGHNVAFDVCVLMAHAPSLVSPILSSLSDGQIVCSMLQARLYENARGCLQRTPRASLKHEKVGPFSLAACTWRYLGKDISEGKSEDSWRYRFAELIDLESVDAYPSEAADYAVQDAVVTGKLYFELLNLDKDFCRTVQKELPDEFCNTILSDIKRRTRAAVALRLLECWGVRTDASRVSSLESHVDEAISENESRMKSAGLMRDDGTLDLLVIRERVSECFSSQGKKPPMTEKGCVKTDRETLSKTGDPILAEHAKCGFAQKVKSTFLPIVKKGVKVPVHARYQSMVETGRTSCSNPPLQQIPRSAGKLSVRECFVPRRGMAFVASDYDAVEMRTFAQVLLDQVGFSDMATKFQANPSFDPHTDFAMKLSNNSWDSITDKERKNLRTRSKACNFGFSGGLGIETFMVFCRGFGLELSQSEAQSLKVAWFNAYPEVRQYFDQIKKRLSYSDPGNIFHARSNRMRGGCTFTQMANSPFQGMSADGALNALWLVASECYGDPSSPLYGCRPVLYIHDEIIIEAPTDRVHEAGHRLSDLMVKGMSPFTPDVPIQASPVAMDRWSKDAEPVFDEAGKLQVWLSN